MAVCEPVCSGQTKPVFHGCRARRIGGDAIRTSCEDAPVADIPAGFPEGFFARGDETQDAAFYAFPRYVTHIDNGAIAAVGALYEELAVDGAVLDLMSSWVSHFRVAPDAL